MVRFHVKKGCICNKCSHQRTDKKNCWNYVPQFQTKKICSFFKNKKGTKKLKLNKELINLEKCLKESK